MEMSKVVVSAEGKGLRQQITAGEHLFVSDAPVSVGGQDSAADPHQLLLAALGACTAMTMQIYATRKGLPLAHVKVELEDGSVEDPDSPGKKRTLITRKVEVSGPLSPEQVEALKSAAEKCPIHKILAGPKVINTAISLH
jgi:uncharacterized OsmC-like protein